MFFIGLIIGLALYLWWMAKDAFFLVDEGQVGLVIRFGAARHGPDGKLLLAGPGLHFKWPFEQAKVVSLREQLITLGGEQGAEPMMLNDGTVIRLQSMLRYAPQREGIAKYLFGLHHRREHVAGLFSSLLRNEIANVKGPVMQADLKTLGDDLGGSFALVRRDRKLLNDRIADFARKELGDYGVTFEAVDITDIHPPDELADALNAVMSARAEAEAMRFRSQSECAQRVMAAEQGVEIARTRAAAVEEEITELGRHLGALDSGGVLDAYLSRRRAEVLSESRTVYLKDEPQNGAAR
ncbi:MAG: SPFH domain-containing protein [Archangium sp.]|nr:SPFH domain-containing protein [Archangium sp.]